MSIVNFRNEYKFLSNNFKGTPIYLDGKPYKTVIHAFYASRLSGNTEIGSGYRRKIQYFKNPASVRSWASEFIADPTWEQRKLEIMERLLRQKFSDKKLFYYLKETYPVELCNSNKNHDTFWGICKCDSCNFSGQNHLGKILMSIREEAIKE